MGGLPFVTWTFPIGEVADPVGTVEVVANSFFCRMVDLEELRVYENSTYM